MQESSAHAQAARDANGDDRNAMRVNPTVGGALRLESCVNILYVYDGVDVHLIAHVLGIV